MLHDQPRKTAFDIAAEALAYVASASARLTEAEFERAMHALDDSVGGAAVPTLVEQWLERGWKEGLDAGLHEAVEVALERFGEEGLTLLPEVRAIEDVKVLRAILRAKSVGEVRQAIR